MMDTDDKKGWLKTRPGERCFIRVPAGQTGGVYSAVEITSEPGDATPLHCHVHEDEHLIVLEGIAKVAVGGQVFCAKVGEAVRLPRHVPHAWGNRSSKLLRMVMVAMPGGVEEALRIIAAGDFRVIPMVAQRFGVTNLGPPPF
jgi:mannose-6-phosphate isomerase-like protein (cupin superfamily)